MDFSKLLIPGLLLVGVLYGGAKLKAKKTLSNVVSFTFKSLKIDWKKLQIIVGLGIQNPSNGTAKLNSLVGSLFIDNKEIASVTSFQPLQIEANQVSILNVQLKPSLLGIFGTLKKLVKSKGANLKGINAEFKGNANVDGFTFPVNTKLS